VSVPVIIQAGGKGTRLRPFTSVLPKPLMPVGDVPILEIVVRQLAYYGFNDLYVTTGHLAHLIESFFGDGSDWGVRIKYVREDRPLGTIGPVRKVPRPDGPFIVMNGDLLTDLDYRALYEYHVGGDALLTVSVYRGDVPVSLGVIDYNEERQIVGFREKPSLHFWASMGIYVFSSELWDLIPPDVCYGFDSLMADLLSQKRSVRVFPWNGLWLDIGRPEDYERAADEIERSRYRVLR
jgi:NDP-sugar pyrophosphorylase family protein